MHKILLTLALLFSFLVESLAFNISREITKISDKEFKVTVHFENMDVSGFAHISETIPSGFTVEQGNSNGGKFSFRDNKMKIIWLNVPSDKNYEIDYTIKVDGNPVSNTINGVYGYIVNDNKSSMNLSPGEIPYNLGNSSVASTPTPKAEPKKVERAPEKKAEPKNEPVYTSSSSSQTGITYHVQIGALTNPNHSFPSAVNNLAPIERKKYGSIYKYLSGSFVSREDAMAHRQRVVDAGITGAFVVKYKDGVRQ